MKKKLWKIWQRFLPVSIWIAIAAIIISGCCLNSEKIIPVIVMGLSFVWLTIILIANDPARIEKEKRIKEKKKHGNDDQEDIAV